MRCATGVCVLGALLLGCDGTLTSREGGRFGVGDGGAWSSSSSGWASSSSGGSSTSSSGSSSSGGVPDAGPTGVDESGCSFDPSFTAPLEVTQALAATQGKLLALLPTARVLTRAGATWIVAAGLPAGGLAVNVLGDGRWVIGRQDELLIERKSTPRSLPVARLSARMAAGGNTVLVPSTEGAWLLDADSPPDVHTWGPRVACSPAAVASWNSRLVLAAPDWPASMVFTAGAWQPLVTHGLFTEETRHAPEAWAAAPSRRVLLPVGTDLIEIASFGTRARLLAHHDTGLTERMDLPAGSYRSATIANAWLVLTAMQSSGEDALVAVVVGDLGTPALVSAPFPGPALGIASVDGAVFALTADALHEFRVSADAVEWVASHHP